MFAVRAYWVSGCRGRAATRILAVSSPKAVNADKNNAYFPVFCKRAVYPGFFVAYFYAI